MEMMHNIRPARCWQLGCWAMWLSEVLTVLNHFLSVGKSYGTEVDWMDSTPPEVALWEKMRASPNEWVEGVLPLRMLNSAKTALK